MGFLALGLTLTGSCIVRAQTADNAISLPATYTTYIGQQGPQKGPNAEKYFNIEGKSTGKYACFGVIRFNGKVVKGELDTKYGEGKYKVTDVTLKLTQSNASFSKDGTVFVYFSQDDSAEPTALQYPYDPKGKTLMGAQVGILKYVKDGGKPQEPAKGEAGKEATSGVTTDSCNLSSGVAGKALATALAQGKTVTLVLAEGDPTVAATYAGFKPVGQRKAPSLVIKASAK